MVNGNSATFGISSRKIFLLFLISKRAFLLNLCYKMSVHVTNINLRLSRQCLGEIVSACEFMDSLCMTSVNDILGLASPLEDSHPFYYLASYLR